MYSYERLAAETNLSVKNVRTAIKHLKRTGEVASSTTSKSCLFTVINYEKYQQVADQVASEGQASGNNDKQRGRGIQISRRKYT